MSFDDPSARPLSMPTKLKVVIASYVVSMAIDGWMLSLDTSATRVWVRLAIGALVIAFLVRGSDSVRGIVRAFAALGVVFGVVILLQALALGMSSTAGMIALGAGSFAVGMNAFTFWALGQDDVQTWMATRTFGRVED